MTKPLKISVILPTYNRKVQVIEAIWSVLEQTAVERIGEIIVVDDGSTDGTFQELRRLADSRASESPEIVVLLQENHGVSKARNEGLKASRYPIVAFLDSDDTWLPTKIEAQMSEFDRNSEIDFLGCSVLGEELQVPFTKIKRLHRVTPLQMQVKSFPVTPSIVMKRKIFEEIGGFDEGLKHYEDCDYWQRICFSGYGVYHLQDGLVKLSDKMRFGESGLSANLKSVHSDVVRTLKKHFVLGYFGVIRLAFLRIYYEIKHYRRIIIVKLKKSI